MEEYSPVEGKHPGGDEDVHDGVGGHEPGQQLPGELGEAGEEEHVGGGEQLAHHLLRHLAVVGVHEVDHTAEH